MRKILLLFIILLLVPSVSFAEKPHEDPEKAPFIFSPFNLLRYLSETQDHLIRREGDVLKERIAKLEFANIPEEIRPLVSKIGEDEILLSSSLLAMDEKLSLMGASVSKYMFEEGVNLGEEALIILKGMEEALSRLRDEFERLAKDAGVFESPGGSPLRKIYGELVLKLDKESRLVELERSLLTSYLLSLYPFSEELLKKLGVEKFPKPSALLPTELILIAEPREIFVGDNLNFFGFLSSMGYPMPGREVEVFLDGSSLGKFITDEKGFFEGSLKIPYRYTENMLLEAFYIPKGDDVGRYLASRDRVMLKILFYRTYLHIELGKAYPGLPLEVKGELSYGNAPKPLFRDMEFYLDGEFVKKIRVYDGFEEEIDLPEDMDVGVHNLSISVLPEKRYAPFFFETSFYVRKAIPVLDADVPGIAVFPGRIGVGGNVSSEIGPVSGLIKLSIDDSEAISYIERGEFSVSLWRGMRLDLFGSKKASIYIIPDEPWNSQIALSFDIFVINWLSSLILLMLILAPFSLLRLRRKPVREERAPAFKPLHVEEKPSGILGFYRRILLLLSRLFGLIIRPQETLREFLRRASPYLGKLSSPFEELTRLVELSLYSRRKPDEREGERLGKEIEEGLGEKS